MKLEQKQCAVYDNPAFEMHPIVATLTLLISSIDFDPENRMVRITWNSRLGVEYTVLVSLNLVDWNEIGSVIPSDGEETAVDLEVDGSWQFIRVREKDVQ